MNNIRYYGKIEVFHSCSNGRLEQFSYTSGKVKILTVVTGCFSRQMSSLTDVQLAEEEFFTDILTQ